MKFVGLDFAFANNGIVQLDEDANIITSAVTTTNKKNSDEERLIYIRETIRNMISKDDIVYLEGLSYSSQGQAKAQMGAVHYLTRIFLFENGIKYKIVTPSELKKFITGKGQCKKDLILLNVFKKWGVEFDNSDLADAYGLARMALEDHKK
jgi:crossover junction endodeoxyribonuclease RuvC